MSVVAIHFLRFVLMILIIGQLCFGVYFFVDAYYGYQFYFSLAMGILNVAFFFYNIRNLFHKT